MNRHQLHTLLGQARAGDHATAAGRLAPDARAIAEMRATGQGWPEIAARHGKSPDAARKQSEPAIDRALEAMGLNDPDDA